MFRKLTEQKLVTVVAKGEYTYSMLLQILYATAAFHTFVFVFQNLCPFSWQCPYVCLRSASNLLNICPALEKYWSRVGWPI